MLLSHDRSGSSRESFGPQGRTGLTSRDIARHSFILGCACARFTPSTSKTRGRITLSFRLERLGSEQIFTRFDDLLLLFLRSVSFRFYRSYFRKFSRVIVTRSSTPAPSVYAG